MTITELATLVDEELRIRWCSNMSYWIASFHGGETKKDSASGILTGESGRGNSTQDALRDYVNNLKGKVLVFNAMDKTRRKEFKVPTSLTV